MAEAGGRHEQLDEVLALSDRIGVIYKGKLVAIIPRAQATREKLGILMTGGTGDESAGTEREE